MKLYKYFFIGVFIVSYIGFNQKAEITEPSKKIYSKSNRILVPSQINNPIKKTTNNKTELLDEKESSEQIVYCQPINAMDCQCDKDVDKLYCLEKQVETVNKVYKMTYSISDDIASLSPNEQIQFENDRFNLVYLQTTEFQMNWAKFQLDSNNDFSCPTEEYNCMERDELSLIELEQAQMEVLATRAEEDYQFQREMDYNHQNN